MRGFPDGLVGEESACNAGDVGSIPGLGRSPGGGHGIHSNILAWRIPWTEEPGGLQSIGLQSDMNEVTEHAYTYLHIIMGQKYCIERCVSAMKFSY